MSQAEDATSIPLRASPWATLIVALASAAWLMTLPGCASPGVMPAAAPITAAPALGLVDADMPALSATWWQQWGDTTLDGLIEQALRDQPSLQAAATRVQRAGALVALSEAVDGLQVGASADVTRQRYSANGLIPPPLAGHSANSANLQVAASWSVDFFGRNQAALQAALGSQRAQAADVATARQLLATQVARSYFALGRLLAQREVAQRALAQRTQMLDLIRQRVRAGLDTQVELRQGEGALPDARLQIEQLDEQITLARHQLATLSAQPIDALAQLSPLLPMAATSPPLQQLGADLLGRRPEVVAARWRVEAATQDMAGARAAFYPDVRLNAFVGLNALGLDKVFDFGSRTLGAGPAVHLPLFDGGALRAQLRGKGADLDLAIAQYNGALREVVREAADALSSTVSLQRQRTEQAATLESAESAYDLARQRYAAGLGNYLLVLQAETQWLAQRRSQIDLQARVLDNQAALMKSLGGGWRDAPQS